MITSTIKLLKSSFVLIKFCIFLTFIFSNTLIAQTTGSLCNIEANCNGNNVLVEVCNTGTTSHLLTSGQDGTLNVEIVMTRGSWSCPNSNSSHTGQVAFRIHYADGSFLEDGSTGTGGSAGFVVNRNVTQSCISKLDDVYIEFSGTGEYSFSTSFAPVTNNDIYEPNNSESEPREILLNEKIEATVNFGFDNVDYYQWTSSENASFALSCLSTDRCTALNVYRNGNLITNVNLSQTTYSFDNIVEGDILLFELYKQTHCGLDNPCKEYTIELIKTSGCTNPEAHNYNEDAQSDDKSCESCTDGIQNGDETEIDCGGSDCNPCQPNPPTGLAFEEGTIIDNGCNNAGQENDGISVPITWTAVPNVQMYNIVVLLNGSATMADNEVTTNDFVLDFPGQVIAGEAYLDAKVRVMVDGQWSEFSSIVTGTFEPFNTDCPEGCTDANAHNFDVKAIVDNGTCETCSDGVQNGDETDIDCGGSTCAPCCSDITLDFNCTQSRSLPEDACQVSVTRSFSDVEGGVTSDEPITRWRYTLALNDGDESAVTEDVTISPEGWVSVDEDITITYPQGTSYINIEFENECGNIASTADLSMCNGSIRVDVKDDKAPTIQCQQDQEYFITSTIEPATITVEDIDNGSFDICTPYNELIRKIKKAGEDDSELRDVVTFGCFEMGEREVVFVVMDNAPTTNVSRCTATVVIKDGIKPTVQCKDITVQLDALGSINVDPDDLLNGARDNCGGPTFITDVSQTTFNCGDIGMVDVTITVSDLAGNTENCVAKVTVLAPDDCSACDDEAPAVSCHTDLGIELENGSARLTVDMIASAIDNCTLSDELIKKIKRAEEGPDDFRDYIDFGCEDVGVQFVAIEVADGATEPNIGGCVVGVRIIDALGPTIICKEFIDVNLDNEGKASITLEQVINSIDDDCSTAFSSSLSQTNFTCADIGANEIIVTVKDESDNESTCSLLVNIIAGDNCPTCNDGIQNGGEKGVDCGGLRCEPCRPDPPTDVRFAEGDIVDNGCDNLGADNDGISIKVEWEPVPGANQYAIWLENEGSSDQLANFIVGSNEFTYDCESCIESDFTTIRARVQVFLDGAWSFYTPFTRATYEPVNTDCPEGCTEPDSHNYDPDALYDNGSCETCTDGIQNGDETEVDCGGQLCEPCAADIDNDGDGYSENQGDCDDSEPLIFPNSLEYLDADGDGYGDADNSRIACQPANTATVASLIITEDVYVLNNTDCDDDDPNINPGAEEICDGLDNNCNGQIDIIDGVSLRQTWYVDADGDGYGDPNEPGEVCFNDLTVIQFRPEDLVDNAEDCDDSYPNINPGTTEIPGNTIDENCDELIEAAECEHPDYDALIALYNSTDGTNWTDNTGWADGAKGLDCEPCGWYGVECNEAGRVICIDLDGSADCSTVGNHDGNNLNGTLPEEISGLTELEGLWLDDNLNINGTIPDGLYDLTNLVNLDLQSNELTGIISENISQLTNLKILTIGTNQISGSLPESMQTMTNLTNLNIYRTQVSGSLPEWLPMLTNLREIGLWSNNFSGCIPKSYKYFCEGEHPRITGNPDLEGEGDFQAFCDSNLGQCPTLGCTAEDSHNYNPEADQDDDSCLTCTDGLQNGDETEIDCGGQLCIPCDQVDRDGDQYSEADGDCDDTNPDIYPGAEEICGNGIDEDCNGLDLDCADVDDDEDGFTENQGDCDDSNPNINPSAEEICGNDIDENCDGTKEECPPIDADEDGNTTADGDCDDNDKTVYPGAPEICDGRDNNCNGSYDEGVTLTYYRDRDGDGFGDNSRSVQRCSPRVGYVTKSGDCDDRNSFIYPGATEICGNGIDEDCNGADLSCLDVDNDGDGYTESQGDCDDTSNEVYPGATEICDGLDNDCDGQRDEGLRVTLYADFDGDGYGAWHRLVWVCEGEIPDYAVTNRGDCDDDDPTVYPGAPEICEDGKVNDCRSNGEDANCIGSDNDNDGHTTDGGDCDDNNPQIYPGATETCDGLDNDCDGSIDEFVQRHYYVDSDGDGYGDPNNRVYACTLEEGLVRNGKDCDDTNADVYPGAEEICGDGIANDCSGGADEACPDYDMDDDGYTEEDGDCDDNNPDIHPGAKEYCGDGIDSDCNGKDDPPYVNYYGDFDGDGYGAWYRIIRVCGDDIPSYAVSNRLDCDDDDAAVYPGAPEICGDDIDQNCDGADRACPEKYSGKNINQDEVEQIDINTFDRELNVLSFPNPTTGWLNISITSNQAAEARLHIFNIMGQEMISRDIQIVEGSQAIGVDLSQMNTGIYVMQLKSTDGIIHSERIIKE